GRREPALRLGIGRHGIDDAAVVRLEGTLPAPVPSVMHETGTALIQGGGRLLPRALPPVTGPDPAGGGELLRVHPVAARAGAVLRLAHPTRRVRALLGLARLLEPLGAEPIVYLEKCS